MKKFNRNGFSQTFFLLFMSMSIFMACSKDDDEDAAPISQRTISKDITVDTTIRNVEKDSTLCDCMVSNNITIRAVVTLEPGVVMCFGADRGLSVEKNGALIAKGTIDNKIIFTGAEKIKGYWRGMLFFSGDVRNELDHVSISYGGGDPVEPLWYDKKANIALAASSIFNGKVKLTNSYISNSSGHGLSVQTGGVIAGFSNNSFKDNNLNSVSLPANEVSKLDGTSKYNGNNGEDEVEIIASTLNNPTESVWPTLSDGSSYRVRKDGNYDELLIASGVKIEEGATFLFDPETSLVIEEEGYLVAKGSSSRRIKFTGKVQTAASWKGMLFFSGNVLNEMEYADVSFGGSSPANNLWFNKNANVALAYSSIFSGRLKITNSAIKNSGGYGIAGQGSSQLTQSNNTFSSNALSNVAIGLQ
jgi:hypothetical protein